ncbi:hypothetical protein HAX54_016935, partial [Datura stramonium]|nr:hypothetical protein [Datura stramonium]
PGLPSRLDVFKLNYFRVTERFFRTRPQPYRSYLSRGAFPLTLEAQRHTSNI